MRKTIATIGMTFAALGLTAGAASASTAADQDQVQNQHEDTTSTNVDYEYNKVNGAGSLVNVSDVLNDADIANNLLAGGVDADVNALNDVDAVR